MSRVLLLCVGIASVLAPAVVSSNTWNVDQAASCSDSTCAPCCTIQAAIERSSDGDTISVAPGTYTESLDLRDMLSVGDITLEAGAGPGTVLVSPTAGSGIYAGGSVGLVLIDGIDFTSPDESCVWLAHNGGAVLYDVTANGCGYTAVMLDNTGNITLRRCTANTSARHGIQIDGASGVYMEDCTTNTNAMDGVLIINLDTMAELVNPTAVGNGEQGLDFDIDGYLIVRNATVTDNAGRGIWAWVTAGAYIENSDIQGSGEVGVDIEWNGVDPVDLVSLTGSTVSGNGLATGDSGVRLREVVGPVTVTDCVLDGNGFDGLSVESSVVGDVEISGGRANGNADDGYDLRMVGDLTVTGASASNNAEYGFTVDSPGRVVFDSCSANANLTGSGINIFWHDPDLLDEVVVVDCTANGNGVVAPGSGIFVSHVGGPVSVLRSQTNGNSGPGVRIDAAAGSVLVRGAESSLGLADGLEIDADVGPVTVLDTTAVDNVGAGLVVRRETVDVENVLVRRNVLGGNGSTGAVLSNLAGAGPFRASCNDIQDNDGGMYLDAPVTVDARWVWWGNSSGPSGQGPGSGDSIHAEPGGSILHSPWLPLPLSSSDGPCEFFGSAFESGLVGEWDVVVP
ncbi:MAG TPA: right-handed parallel beta-helix repeat-containing protein [Candidatus Sulfomarinibacteraceae bacterium]|nr:right-handed parallel beta-helix repeat-containing protein [Candidatus Sulfomarinibacteraceae bacterium]